MTMPKINQKGSYRSHSPIHQDTRTGLGYGITQNRFHNPRGAQSSYPYVEADPYEDDEFDIAFDQDDLDIFVNKTNAAYAKTDPLAGNGTDPFYFVGGNTRGLSGVMEQMAIAKNSIVPMPGWSKKIQAVSGGYTQQPAYDERSYRRTGTLQGYAHLPPKPNTEIDDEIGAYTLWDVLQDDELAMAKTRATQDKIEKMSKIQEVRYGFI